VLNPYEGGGEARRGELFDNGAQLAEIEFEASNRDRRKGSVQSAVC
jgi:hypothetical protein